MCDRQLVHVACRTYSLNCNWKVFVDNYLVRCSGVHVSTTCQTWPNCDAQEGMKPGDCGCACWCRLAHASLMPAGWRVPRGGGASLAS